MIIRKAIWIAVFLVLICSFLFAEDPIGYSPSCCGMAGTKWIYTS